MKKEQIVTLGLHQRVRWVPDGMEGMIVGHAEQSIRIAWDDGQFGDFSDLVSQIERVEISHGDAPQSGPA